MSRIYFYGYGRTTIRRQWLINETLGVNRLYYVHHGEAAYAVGEKKTIMQAGNFYFFPVCLPVRFFVLEQKSFDHTFFDFLITPSFLLQQAISFPGNDSSLVQAIALFDRFFQDHGRCSQTEEFLRSHFETILFLLKRQAPLSQSKDVQMEQALETIHRNFSAPPSVSRLADQAHMDQTHFIRRFKKAVGTTPCQYSKRCRMNAALSMLREGESVQNTAQACGYQSSAAFSAAFYHHFGQYPSKISLE